MRLGPPRRAAWAVAATLALGGVLLFALWRSPSEPPRHFILVVFDTLRADRMALYGHHRSTTPFLERKAGEMVRFARAKAPAPWTVPSHASIFTGLWPGEHRAQWGGMRLAGRHRTLAEILAARGFCTVGASANELISRRHGFAQGFDEYRVFRGDERRHTEHVLKAAEFTLRQVRRKGCRLFLFLNFMDTHLPYHYRPYAAEMGVDEPPPIRTPEQKWRASAGVRELDAEEEGRHRAAYDAAVRYVDDVVARLFEALREKGFLEESVLVITSDHGDGLGHHPQLGHSISVWEEQLAVPLLVRRPGGTGGGKVVERRQSLVGIAPSALDWLGIARPEPLRDRPGLGAEVESPVVAEYRDYFSEGEREWNARMAKRYPRLARSGQHRHVLYCGHGHKLIVGADGETELYDLHDDPHEQHDLAPQRPEALDSCRGSYAGLAREVQLYTPFDAEASGAAEGVDLEALRALGYVE